MDHDRTGDAAIDVLGIGNALVDVISHEDAGFLDDHSLVKGSMTLIETDRAESLYDAMGPGIEQSGGSAANTVTGVASFGGRAAYVGKVAADQLGEVFLHDLRALGVTCTVPRTTGSLPTGRCLIVVTPDGQRTMNTYLGVSELLAPADVDLGLVAAAAVTYMEGYLWDKPAAMEAYRTAARAAHAAGRTVSLTLSDSFCVERHRPYFLDLVETEVDILFANEHEICTLYEVDAFDDALQRVRHHCEVAALTRSAQGSVIVSGDEVHVIDAHQVPKVVDTTGAGDLYASGFLYGWTAGYDLATCGRLGSLAAAEVISHTGARPGVPLARLAPEVLDGRPSGWPGQIKGSQAQSG